jgi:type II secretory pathway pseudopilin PulG
MRMKKGFQVVDVLIVIVVLGIIVAVLVPQFNKASREAGEKQTAKNLWYPSGAITKVGEKLPLTSGFTFNNAFNVPDANDVIVTVILLKENNEGKEEVHYYDLRP